MHLAEIFHAGVGNDSTARLQLRQPRNNPGASSFRDKHLSQVEIVYSEEVSMVTLDEVLNDTRAILLKVDVEGFETRVRNCESFVLI